MKSILFIAALLFSFSSIVEAASCQRLMAKELFKMSGKMVAAKNNKDPFKGILFRKRFRELKDTKALFKDVKQNGTKRICLS